MINKKLEEISLEDLRQLKDNAVSEGKSIEYKKELPGPKDKDKKEFLADISSFANASGGDLIYGIAESKGVPQSIDGVQIENIDETVRKYASMILAGIEPRITFATHNVKVSENKYTLIFRVSKSWNSPNRVIYQEHDKFYSRNAMGKYPLDVGELRTVFNLSQNILDKIVRFKDERIYSLYDRGNTPVPFCEGGKVILHLIPFEAFSPGFKIDLSSVVSYVNKLQPVYASGYSQRRNLEGVLSSSADEAGVAHSYVQLYRNGIVEAVEGLILRPTKTSKIIASYTYEYELLIALGEYIGLLRELGVNAPIAVYLTLTGVQGWRMSPNDGFRDDSFEINQDTLQLPETILESYDMEPADILRPMFDIVWNACGYEKSRNFTEDGLWISR